VFRYKYDSRAPVTLYFSSVANNNLRHEADFYGCSFGYCSVLHHGKCALNRGCLLFTIKNNVYVWPDCIRITRILFQNTYHRILGGGEIK
jgi:hypothetical protein